MNWHVDVSVCAPLKWTNEVHEEEKELNECRARAREIQKPISIYIGSGDIAISQNIIWMMVIQK